MERQTEKQKKNKIETHTSLTNNKEALRIGFTQSLL